MKRFRNALGSTRTAARTFLFSSILATAASAAHAACSPGYYEYILDWDVAFSSWPAGSTNNTISVPESSGSGPSENVRIRFRRNTNYYLSGFPVVDNTFNASERSLNVAADFPDNSTDTRILIILPQNSENVTFRIHDIDDLSPTNGSGGFRDSVEIVGNGANTYFPSLSTPYHQAPTNTHPNSYVYLGAPLADNQAYGFGGNSQATDDAGDLIVSFSQPISRVIVTYSNRLNPPSPDPDPQGIGIGDISFCLPDPSAPPQPLQATKTVSIHSQDAAGCDVIPGAPPADPGALFAVPGACMEYVISVSNPNSTAISDIAVSDVLPPHLVYQASNVSGFDASSPAYSESFPAPGTDCGASSCSAVVVGAALAGGGSGTITIRATLK